MTDKNQSEPLVSIIVAVYNIEKYIGDCLESILQQTYTNWEAIVVNDGSTDNSLSICNSYSARDSRFKIITVKNGGASNARNHGLESISGEYVMMVDGDDMITPNAIEVCVNKIQEHKLDIVISNNTLISEDNKKRLGNSKLPIHNHLDANTLLSLIHGGMLTAGIWAKLYRAQLLSDTRFNPKLILAEDMFFNTELLINHPNTTAATISDQTYLYRMRTRSVSHNRETRDKIRYYSEAMTDFIFSNKHRIHPELVQLMSNSLFGAILSNIYEKNYKNRLPSDWQKAIIIKLSQLVSNHSYKVISKKLQSSSNQYCRYYLTKRKYQRNIKRFIRRVKQRVFSM